MRPYYSPRTAGIYLAGILRNNGFDEKGRPLPAPLGTGGSGRARKAERRVPGRGGGAV
ncbi:hypothetical protein [Streptomyces sp. NPDC001401]|uniref:hypothetical protein n=1 Tax=Streptomyces sp. NPDC001401 TaxID=3364570 RepID=UPI0036C39DF0